ncbi:MAG: 5'/3'-nucleotidase SurE [Candidatus Puniceispirillales bacterium]
MKRKLKNILITNDDGFDAIGIKILSEIAEKLGENVYVISPKKNQSATSKSITVRNNINYKKISNYNWIVDGTPTDCMIFALNHIFKLHKPDLILSGINAGSNIGDEVSYSGTVAAAWEGAVRGINSIALSQFGGDNDIFSYNNSKNNALNVINYLLDLNLGHPKFYNVNFPFIFSEILKSKDYFFTKLASQKKADEIIINQDNNSFSIGRMINHNECLLNSDLETLKKNKISITPLSLNLTNNLIINNLKIS